MILLHLINSYLFFIIPALKGNSVKALNGLQYNHIEQLRPVILHSLFCH